MITAFSKHLFWDIDINTFDVEKNARWLIERVVTRGFYSDWLLLKNTYDADRIKTEALQIRALDKKSLNFLSKFFNLPIENFRCFKQTQSTKTHWSY